MACLQVKGFAGLELSGNGLSILSFSTHHVEELLGYLLLNQNKTFDRDYLIELLWPYDVSENNRGRLNTVLWRLRRIFRQMGFSAESFLQSSQDLIIFSPTEDLQFDVYSFRHHLDAAWAAKDDSTKIVELTKATDLYKGDLYAGILSDWCLIERERLARNYLKALNELMQCYMRQNNFAKAIEVGQTIIGEDPLREEVHRALIACYGRLGHRAEAAAQFQQCADYLMVELQILPMPDTVSVYQQVMTASIMNILDTPNSELLKQAHRAHTEFRQADDKLNKILDEIENSRTEMNC